MAEQSEVMDPTQWGELHQGRLQAMIEVAQAAGQHTLTHFRSDSLVVDAKSDDSPVTIADREAEKLVRKRLGARFPDDTVQGEEFAEETGSSPYRWVVDPIDGTKSFVCGVPLYSTLLALEHEGTPIGGVIYIPALAEMVVGAVGHGSWHRGGDLFRDQRSGEWHRALVSSKRELKQAVFVTSQVDSFAARQADAAYRALEERCWISRSWGDGYGYLMIATGRADIMVDPVCNAWDVAAILPVVNEAGGRFTDWGGNSTIRGGDGVGTNGHLHDQVLPLLTSN